MAGVWNEKDLNTSENDGIQLDETGFFWKLEKKVMWLQLPHGG